MSVGDIILACHVDRIKHSVDVGVVLLFFNRCVHRVVQICIAVGGTNSVFIKLYDSVQAVGLQREQC